MVLNILELCSIESPLAATRGKDNTVWGKAAFLNQMLVIQPVLTHLQGRGIILILPLGKLRLSV